MVGVSGTSRLLTTSYTLPICFPRQTSGTTVRPSGWYRSESTRFGPRCWMRCAWRETPTGPVNTWHWPWPSLFAPNAFLLCTKYEFPSLINMMIFEMIYDGFKFYWLGVGWYRCIHENYNYGFPFVRSLKKWLTIAYYRISF